MHTLNKIIRPIRTVLKTVAIGVSVLALTACHDLLQTEGTAWVDKDGNKINLRGVNLGNWLAMEMWMFDHGENPIGEGIVDQCTLEATLRERFGDEEQERLIKKFRDSWLTEADWDQMAAAGFNLIRVPFLYDMIEDDDNPMTLRPDAWHYLDWAIDEASKRDMYVILDLHGAPGRQGWEHHTGCEGINELWDSEEYRERTKWLWRKISIRYKRESTVAGYGLLNEPWGTDAQTLADFSIELHDVVRNEEDEHVVILPGHNSGGISAYPHPADLDMENIAYEIHAYPGIFGWGEIGYKVHRDWLTCGADGTEGVCAWQADLEERGASMLIGETQTWTGLGELGGEITRASYDRYNELGWAVTGWSYKTVTNAGGTGNGVWGFITNQGDQLLTKAETWSCDNWESTFENACANGAKSVVPFQGEGTQTMYLAIKTGAFNGTDVIYDNIQLVNDQTGENILSNGDFGSDASWTEIGIWPDGRRYDFNYEAGEFAGSDTGPALRVTSPAGNNSVLFQAVTVEGGQSYTLSGKFADIGGNDMWAEIYLVPDMPVEGQEVDGRVLPEVDMNTSSLEEIDSFFTSFATMDYEVNEWVMASLTSAQPAVIFTTIPSTPSDLTLVEADNQVSLDWSASEGIVDGYYIYRSASPNAGYEVLASSSDSEYVDTGVEESDRFFYKIAAYNNIDESYTSEMQGTDPLVFEIPGHIEAEDFVAGHKDVQVADSGDGNDESYNVGWFEPGRWLEYQVIVEEAGLYTAQFRVASLPGSEGFEVHLGADVLATVEVPETEAWDNYQTIDVEMDLAEGEQTLRLQAISGGWNINWMRFTRGLVTPTPAPGVTPVPGSVDLLIANPEIGAGGSNTNVTIVANTEKGKDVIRLEVLASNNTEQAYARVSFDVVNLSNYRGLSFDILDTQGANTAYVTLTDVTGASWSAWTSDASVHNSWSTLFVDYSAASSAIDLTQVVEVSAAQWNSGIYYLSDFTFKAQLPTGNEDWLFPNSTSGTGGSNANVTSVGDAEKGKNVVSLEVLNSGNVDEAYATINLGDFDELDFSLFASVEFDIFDTQGSNTAYLVFWDANGTAWGVWTSQASAHNEWTTISVDLSSVETGFDLTRVTHFTVAQWNSGIYYLSDFSLIAATAP